MDFAKATKYLSAAGACLAIACSDGATKYTKLPDGMDDTNAAPKESVEAGVHRTGDELALQTDPFTVGPGEEKYMCWTGKVPEAVKVRSYSKDKRQVLHHVLLATTTKEEPEGIRDCGPAFQLNWHPLFAAGAGKVELAFPPGVVDPIDDGAQIVVQLHLVNTSDRPITDSASLVMTTTDDEQTENVHLSVFGNTDVNLPPAQPSSLVMDCQNPATTRAIGFFPHMHVLGTSITLEVGPTADSMHTLYQRDPYDFNDQAIDTTDTMITAGSHARLTCNYDNTRPEAVTYGESTFNEMCYLIMFVVGSPTGCITGSAPLTQ